MIVLDEQLLGYDLQARIAEWYRGPVLDITQLRPGTVIKDEAIPVLLRPARGPTFVTINVRDFWRKLAADPRFMIACFALPDAEAESVSPLLRSVFRLEPFRTRKVRLGKIARITDVQVRYYSVESRVVRTLELAC